MEPNRSLDALVAERVMGWHREQNKWCNPDGHIHADIDWNPSSDIAAAWEVVQKMRSKDETSGIILDVSPCDETWRCQIGSSCGAAESAPLAICLAALRAVGVDPGTVC